MNNDINKLFFFSQKALQFPTFIADSLSKKTIDIAAAFPDHVTLLLIAMRGIAQVGIVIVRVSYAFRILQMYCCFGHAFVMI